MSGGEDDDRRIFVGGLNYTSQEDDIRNYFEQWGAISHVKLIKFPPPDGRSKGFGFVTFENEAGKNRAVDHGPHTIDGKEVEIRLSDKKKRNERRGDRDEDLESYKIDLEEVKFRRLFVGGLSKDWTESVVESYFRSLGTIEECTVKRGQSGESLGFAFMTFKSSMDVDIIQNRRPHLLEGRQVETRRQVAKQYVGKPESKLEIDKIWIGPSQSEKSRAGHVGLDDQHSDEDLEAYFSKYGKVRKIQQLKWGDTGNANKKRGYGFIFFHDTDAVDKVVLHQYHVIKGVKLEVKKAVNIDKKANSSAGSNNSNTNYSNMMSNTNMNNMQNYMQNNLQNNMQNNMQANMHNMMGMMPGSNNMMSSNMMGGNNPMMNNNAGMMGGNNSVMSNTSSMMSGMAGTTGLLGNGMMTGMAMNSGQDNYNGSNRKRGMDSISESGAKKTRLEPRDPECELMRSVFVGNLNPMATRDHLDDYFSKFGKVEKINLKTVPGTDKNKGFAFIVFARSDDVDDVMRMKPHTIMEGTKPVDVKRKTPKDENLYMEEKVKKIWIGRPDEEYRIRSYGLNDSTTDEALAEYFEKFGRVLDIHQFVWKDTNKKRGYGYITFDDTDVVDKIVLLGVHDIAGVKLQTKKALSKEQQESADKKKQETGNSFQQNMGMGNNMFDQSSNQMAAMNANPAQYNNMMNMNNPMMTQMMAMNQMQQQTQPSPMNNMGAMMNPNQGNMNQSSLPAMGQQQSGGMNFPPPNNINTNNSSSQDKFGEMMQNMNSMMGTMQKEVGNNSKQDDTNDKMMGMMGNMMSMMSNMASMIQNKVTPSSPPDSNEKSTQNNYSLPPTSNYHQQNTATSNSVGAPSYGNYNNQGSSSYTAQNTGGYSGGQSTYGGQQSGGYGGSGGRQGGSSSRWDVKPESKHPPLPSNNGYARY